jgi:acetylglutamate kinase
VTVVAAPPELHQRTRAKARLLIECLTYVREHAGATVVVKIGGAAMEDPSLLEAFAEDIAHLRLVGMRPVVVHGGGPQITAMARRLGIEPRFVGGHRVTDPQTLEVVRMVLEVVNQDLVAKLVRQGIPALGLSGADGGLLQVRRRSPELGLVGEVERVNVEVLADLMERYVPVIASVGFEASTGQHLNVNADLVASAIASASGAKKLVYLTDVAGLYGSGGEFVSEAPASECRRLIASGSADGGMIPKLESAVEALQAGVSRAHLVDGRVPHALVLELFTPEGFGTMLTPDLADEGRA